MAPESAHPDISAAIDGELQLMEPSVRTSRPLSAALLDPDFVEVGASGRRWTREEMLAELPGLPGAAQDGPRYEPSGMRGVVPAPGIVLLTYETVIDGARARRSSLWRRDGVSGDWRMYFHQATPVRD